MSLSSQEVIESEKTIDKINVVEPVDDAMVIDLAAKAHIDAVEYTEEESKQVLRKIDFRIIPMVVFLYALQYCDKQTLNYASLMGIKADTNINSATQQYAWLGSIFYAGYLIAEFPMTYLLKKLPIGKLTSVNIIAWGRVLTLHTACTSWAGLMVCRFLLGFFEAVITPAFTLFVSRWYKRYEQGGRMATFLAANGIAVMIVAPVAYGLDGITGGALAPWRILYLLFGLVTVITGIVYLWAMPDSQLSVGWLNDREKAIAVDRVRRSNYAGIGNYVWKWDQFWEALRDPRTWIYFAFSVFENIPNGGLGTFGSIIIASFGFTNRRALLLSLPQGVIDFCSKMIFMNLSDYFQDRTSFAFLTLALSWAGSMIMLYAPQSANGALLMGYYMIGFSGTGWGLMMVLIGNNSVGYTKKATVQGIQIIAYAVGNWIGPQTFRASDAPHYVKGKRYAAIFYGITLVCVAALRVLNMIENRRRDKKAAADPSFEAAQPENAEALDLTDYQQPKFRYAL